MVEERRTVVEEPRPGLATLLRRIVFLVFAIIQALIILRIVLLLLNADQANQYVRWVIDTAGIFVRPFEGILQTAVVSAGGYSLDIAAILALVVWTVVEWVVIAVISVFGR